MMTFALGAMLWSPRAGASVGPAVVERAVRERAAMDLGVAVADVETPFLGMGRALDIWGFILESGDEVTVLDDWEDGNPNPMTPAGALLRSFTDQVWAMSLWNIILTPEYNAAHDNHFHIDRTPGGNTYQ